MENTGENRLVDLHDSWGGVLVPEYESVQKAKPLTVEEIKKNIKWAVERIMDLHP